MRLGFRGGKAEAFCCSQEMPRGAFHTGRCWVFLLGDLEAASSRQWLWPLSERAANGWLAACPFRGSRLGRLHLGRGFLSFSRLLLSPVGLSGGRMILVREADVTFNTPDSFCEQLWKVMVLSAGPLKENKAWLEVAFLPSILL